MTAYEIYYETLKKDYPGLNVGANKLWRVGKGDQIKTPFIIFTLVIASINMTWILSCGAPIKLDCHHHSGIWDDFECCGGGEGSLWNLKYKLHVIAT